MFLFEYTTGEKFRTVACENGNLSLQYRRPAVQFLGNKMDGCPRFAITGIDGALVGVKPRIFGKQGGMNIEQAPAKVSDKVATENPHKASENDQIGSVAVDKFPERCVKGVAGVKTAVIKSFGANASVAGALQAARIGTVADDRANISAE